MSGVARRPVLTIILLVVAELMLLALGSWQLYRLNYKTTLIAGIKQQMQLPAIDRIDQDSVYRQVQLSGKLLHDKALYLYNLNESGAPGYEILVPLQMNDGEVVLVKFGWVASPTDSNNRSQMARDTLVKPKYDQVSGIVLPILPKSMFTPDNEPQNNIWYYLDIEEMSRYLGMQLLPLVLLPNADPHQLPVKIRNDHLGYALMWYSLSLAGAVMFCFYRRQF